MYCCFDIFWIAARPRAVLEYAGLRRVPHRSGFRHVSYRIMHNSTCPNRKRLQYLFCNMFLSTFIYEHSFFKNLIF